MNSEGDAQTSSLQECVRDVLAATVDDGDRAAAWLRVADTAFALAVGSATTQGRRSAAVADALYGAHSVAARAFRLAAACRMTEIDDVDLESCTTPGAIVIPVALSLLASSESGTNADDLLDTVALGYELVVGLGEAMVGPARLAAGVWPSLAVAPVAAAMVTCRLLGGTPDEIERAVLLASQQSVTANPRGTAREHIFATAIVTGLGSAIAVRNGLSTPPQGVDGPLAPLLTSTATTSPGGCRHIRRPVVKQFCSARQAMTAVAAVQQIMEQSHIEPTAVEAIEVVVPYEYAAMLIKPQIHTRRDSLSSVAYQIAIALHDPDGLWDVDRRELAVAGPRADVAASMAAVRVTGSDELSASYPRRWPARVQLTATGTIYEATVHEVPGENDLTLGALTRKMKQFVAVTPGLAAAADEIAAVASAEATQTQLQRLMKLIEQDHTRPTERRGRPIRAVIPGKGVSA